MGSLGGIRWWRAVGMLILAAGSVVGQPLPQKRNVIKIGYLMPFAVPYNPNDEQGFLASSVQTLNSGATYNALLWYINRTNNDPK
ncbi:hypothetical protein HDU67_005646 [Dinochytrium kinnereticum]|nr:hypothetical protein HDU67_005646 [Dinochytrium kinnereticum]